MLGVGGDNFSTGQGGCGSVGGCGKALGSKSKLSLTLPRPFKPVPCGLDFFSSVGESNEYCLVGDNNPGDINEGDISGGLADEDVDTFTVNGCVGVFDVDGSLINGPADNTGSRDVRSIPLGVS